MISRRHIILTYPEPPRVLVLCLSANQASWRQLNQVIRFNIDISLFVSLDDSSPYSTTQNLRHSVRFLFHNSGRTRHLRLSYCASSAIKRAAGLKKLCNMATVDPTARPHGTYGGLLQDLAALSHSFSLGHLRYQSRLTYHQIGIHAVALSRTG